MIGWHRAFAETATAFGALVGTGPTDTRGLDLDVAITARAAGLVCAANVLGDLAPRTRRPTPHGRRYVPVGLLERDPLRALGLMLQHRPRVELARSPSELLDAAAPACDATRAWAAAGRQALLADRAWRSEVAAQPLPPKEAWRTVEEVCALVEGIAVLDHDLTLPAAERSDITEVLRSAHGLGLVTRRAADLAAHPATAARSPDDMPEPPRTSRPPRMAPAGKEPTGRADLAIQAQRLGGLLRTAEELTPVHIRSAAVIGQHLAILAAPAATGADGEHLRAELGAIARHLNGAATANHGEAPVRPTPRQHALEMALADLLSRTRDAFAAGERGCLTPAAADSVARLLPAFVQRLSGQAHAQVAEQRWAIPNRAEGESLPHAFASVSNQAHRPPLLDDLAAARDTARDLHGRLADPSGDPIKTAKLRVATACADLRDLTRARESYRPRTALPEELPPGPGYEIGL